MRVSYISAHRQGIVVTLRPALKGTCMAEHGCTPPQTGGAIDADSPKTRVTVTLSLAIIGLALLLSSTWTARADASGVPTPVVYATRFVTFGVCLAMAWMFRNRPASMRPLLVLACSAMSVRLACFLIAPLLSLDAQVSLVLDYTSAAFEGIANALAMLLFAQVFSLYPPRKSAPAMGVAWLATDVCILFIDTLGGDAMHYVRPAFTVASFVILSLCVRPSQRKLDMRTQGDGAAATAREGQGDKAPLSALAFITKYTDWLLLLIMAFLFSNLFGLIAQVSSETGGNFALFDIPTEIVMIAAQGILLVFFCTFGTRYEFAAILALVIPLYATGFAFFSDDWQAGSPFAGCMIRAGYLFLQVLLWALMARKSYEDPRHTYPYFGVFCALSDAQIGRLVGSALMGEEGPRLSLCQHISFIALWAICIFGLGMFFLLQHRSNVALAQARKAAPSGLPTMSAAAQAAIDAETNACAATPVQDTTAFAEQFELLASQIHLTQREKEVIGEALRGHSRSSIANKLALSPETVKTYTNRAYAKARVNSKQELIALIEERLSAS